MLGLIRVGLEEGGRPDFLQLTCVSQTVTLFVALHPQPNITDKTAV